MAFNQRDFRKDKAEKVNVCAVYSVNINNF